MFEKRVIIGKKYCVTAPSACLITANVNGVVVTLVDESTAGQYYFYAPTTSINSSVDPSYILEVAKSGGASTTVRSGSSCNCEPYELTAEAIQEVAPIKWDNNCAIFGEKALAVSGSVSIGYQAIGHGASVSVGLNAKSYNRGVSVGSNIYSVVACYNAIAIGNDLTIGSTTSITIGASFSDTAGSYTCTTEGTGSITIGAGANTLVGENQYGCDNSVTIGCKANSTTSDSVTIGASAISKGTIGAIAIGAAAQSTGYATIAMGYGTKATNTSAVAVGANSIAKAYGATSVGSNTSCSVSLATAMGFGAQSLAENAIALGGYSFANKKNATAIGHRASISDLGATAIRSTADDGTYTQLYFSGANTPLANTYHDGAPMLGYVTKDSAGNIVAAGTRSLIDLLTDNSTFQPASLDENGEWVQPKVFHPSDLDLLQEEPTEPEEYTPLPVYPIVEPEIKDIEEV